MDGKEQGTGRARQALGTQMVLGAFQEAQGIGVSLEAIIVPSAEESIAQHKPYWHHSLQHNHLSSGYEQCCGAERQPPCGDNAPARLGEILHPGLSTASEPSGSYTHLPFIHPFMSEKPNLFIRLNMKASSYQWESRNLSVKISKRKSLRLLYRDLPHFILTSTFFSFSYTSVV